jgi:hypothetical protein
MWLFFAMTAVSFAGMPHTRKNHLVYGCFIVIFFILQMACGLTWGVDMAMKLYPLVTHVPIVVFIVVYLKRPWVISLTSVFLTFLCYQIPRWFGSFTGQITDVIVSGNPDGILNIVSMNHAGLVVGAILSFYILQKYVLNSVRRLIEHSAKSCLFLGAMPFFYYVFDYVVVIYTNLMYSGNRMTVQFMPFVTSVLFLVFAVLYYDKMLQQAGIQRERDMLDTQFRLAQTEFASLRQLQQNAAVYRHDMRHHFALLQGLASEGQMEELKEYLRAAQADMDAATPIRFCTNETVNLVLSAFAAKSKQSETLLAIDAKLPDSLPFSDTDLCSLLSNALENAIHASRHIADSKSRHIKLHMYTKNNKLCIDIRNSYQLEPIFHNGLPASKDEGHGFGTKSMVHIVEKHGGVCRFSVKDGWFIFQATA